MFSAVTLIRVHIWRDLVSGINGAVEGDALEQWQPGLQDACHFVNLFTRSGFYLFGFIHYSTKHINRSLENFLHVLQATHISVRVATNMCGMRGYRSAPGAASSLFISSSTWNDGEESKTRKCWIQVNRLLQLNSMWRLKREMSKCPGLQWWTTPTWTCSKGAIFNCLSNWTIDACQLPTKCVLNTDGDVYLLYGVGNKLELSYFRHLCTI